MPRAHSDERTWQNRMNEDCGQKNIEKIEKNCHETLRKLYEVDIRQNPTNVLKINNTESFP